MKNTEAKAWRWLSKFYGNHSEQDFICNFLHAVTAGKGHYYCREIPAYLTKNAVGMIMRIDDHTDLGTAMGASGYTLSNIDKFNSPRVIFCELMALECEDDDNV